MSGPSWLELLQRASADRRRRSEEDRAVREEVRLRRLDGWFEEGELEQLLELQEELEEDLDYGGRGRSR